MTTSEAKRMLTRAGFVCIKSTSVSDLYEFDEEIRVAVARGRSKENRHTTREVEQAIRRAENLRRQHEDRAVSRGQAIYPSTLTAPMRAFAKPTTVEARAMLKPSRSDAGDYTDKDRVPPSPPPAPVVEAAPPAPTPTEPEETKGRRAKWQQEDRLEIWRKIAVLHDLEGKTFDEIVEYFTASGMKSPNGNPINSWYVSDAYHKFHKLRDMLKMPKPEARQAAAIPGAPKLPDYVQGMLADPKLTTAQKVGVIRALHPELPSSVELMLDDAALTEDQKYAILAIAMRVGGK